GKEYQQLGIAPIDEVAKVEPGGAADKAGVHTGDRFLTAEGKPIQSHKTFDEMVFDRPGAPLPVEVWREGKVPPLTVVPDKKAARTYGIVVSERPVIRDIQPGTPATQSSLKIGDVVVAANGEAAPTIKGLMDRSRG